MVGQSQSLIRHGQLRRQRLAMLLLHSRDAGSAFRSNQLSSADMFGEELVEQAVVWIQSSPDGTDVREPFAEHILDISGCYAASLVEQGYAGEPRGTTRYAIVGRSQRNFDAL
jgi:hypothetical protein